MPGVCELTPAIAVVVWGGGACMAVGGPLAVAWLAGLESINNFACRLVYWPSSTLRVNGKIVNRNADGIG